MEHRNRSGGRFRCWQGGNTMASVQGEGPEQAVLAAEQSRCAALIEGDIERIAELLHADLIFFHTNGLAQTKSMLLETRRTGPFRYLQLRHSDVRVRIAGELAVLTATISMEMENSALGTQIGLDARSMQVWRLEGGAWKLFAYQTTRVASSG
jgi:ketosteroid isomerase-like protein